MPDPDPKVCCFCGKKDAFVMTCDHVCLHCGDMLQARYGLVVMPEAQLEALRAGKVLVETERDRLCEAAVRYAYSRLPRFDGPEPLSWESLAEVSKEEFRARFLEYLGRQGAGESTREKPDA